MSKSVLDQLDYYRDKIIKKIIQKLKIISTHLITYYLLLNKSYSQMTL